MSQAILIKFRQRNNTFDLGVKVGIYSISQENLFYYSSRKYTKPQHIVCDNAKIGITCVLPQNSTKNSDDTLNCLPIWQVIAISSLNNLFCLEILITWQLHIWCAQTTLKMTNIHKHITSAWPCEFCHGSVHLCQTT